MRHAQKLQHLWNVKLINEVYRKFTKRIIYAHKIPTSCMKLHSHLRSLSTVSCVCDITVYSVSATRLIHLTVLFADSFSGPRRAVSPVCVYACVYEIPDNNFELDDLWPRYPACGSFLRYVGQVWRWWSKLERRKNVASGLDYSLKSFLYWKTIVIEGFFIFFIVINDIQYCELNVSIRFRNVLRDRYTRIRSVDDRLK